MDTRHIPFGIDARGVFRDVDEVPNGFHCGCVCPDCKGPLSAKQGDIKAHHFAHQDRRDCRNALDASLYGMLLTVAREPGATLRVPPCGVRRELVPNPDQVFTPKQAAKFFRFHWVVPGWDVPLESAVLAAANINQGVFTEPEIKFADLHVHILCEARKSRDDVVKTIDPTGPAVLMLDLKAYRKLWWEICDSDKDTSIQVARAATNALKGWLSRSEAGREWAFHPELVRAKEKLRVWIAEKRRAAALRRQEDERARPARPEIDEPRPTPLPPEPPIPPAGPVMLVPAGDAAAYAKPARKEAWLTDHMAAELGLWVHQPTKAYAFIGRPGARVPPLVQDSLAPESQWAPLSEAMLAEYVRASDVIKATLKRYGIQDRPAEK